MRRLGWSLGSVVFLALLLAPSLDAYPAPGKPSNPAVVTLYAHWFDVLNRAPLNTLAPTPAERDLNEGFHMPTLVVRGPCGEPCNVTFEYNEFSLYTVPRDLDAQSSRIESQVGDPAYDVELADGPIHFYFYLSAHPLPTLSTQSDAGGLTNLGLMPSVRAEVLWETGRQFGKGIPIAAGATPAINMVHLPGADPVYEFRVPMGRFIDVIPSGMGTSLTVKVQQVATDTAELQQSNWRLRSGAKYPWRMEVPVENPIIRRDLQTWSLNETLHARWGVRAAFGSYDIDASTFALRLASADGQGFQLAPTLIEESRMPDADLKTVYAHWEIPTSEIVGPGPWRIQTFVQNRQGNAFLEDEEAVSISAYIGAQETPASTAWVGLGALALVALLRRR